MTRPVIGVTVSRRSGWRIFPLLALNIRLAGGRAVRWTRYEDVSLGDAHGVLVGGGDDIAPDLYGGSFVTTARLDPDRDALERQLIRIAMDEGLPVMGICRGAQMLNVALGGTLNQDAYATYRSRKYRTVLPRKTVYPEGGTRLAALTGTGEMKVNALHSQSVDCLGDGLRVAARDEGGMIQAVERTCDPFAFGVQWHPEHLFYARRQRRLFRALVEAARGHARDRSQIGRVDALPV